MGDLNSGSRSPIHTENRISGLIRLNLWAEALEAQPYIFVARVISRFPGGPGNRSISNPSDFKCRLNCP